MLIRRVDELLHKAIFEWTPTHNQVKVINKYFQIFEKKHMSHNVKMLIEAKLADPNSQIVLQERINAIPSDPVIFNTPIECSLKFMLNSINHCIEVLTKETGEHEIIVSSLIYTYFTQYMKLSKEAGLKVGEKEQFIYSV